VFSFVSRLVVAELRAPLIQIYVYRKYYKKYRGWFRSPAWHVGVPVVIAAFNFLNLTPQELAARCFDEDFPDHVRVGLSSQQIKWRIVFPVREAEDTAILKDFFVEIFEQCHINNWPFSEENLFDLIMTCQEMLLDVQLNTQQIKFDKRPRKSLKAFRDWLGRHLFTSSKNY
jgi:hypothetical protein